MKVEQTKISDCRATLVVKASAEETKPVYDKLVADYMKYGSVPGFRQGKAPQSVVVRHFEKEFNQDLKRSLVSKFHQEAIEQEGLAVANVIDISSIIESPNTGVSFLMTLDLVPTFKLPKYKQIPIKVRPIILEEAKVDEQIGNIRRSMTRYEEADGSIATGYMARIDYAATVGGKPMEEACENSGPIAKDEGAWVYVDQSAEDRFPGLSEALIGLRMSDSKELDVKFPKDYPNEAVRGVKAKYTVTVKEMRRPLPPEDEEIAQRFGFENFEDLRKMFSDNILHEIEKEEQSRQNQEIVEYLLKKCDFPLPESVVQANTRIALDSLLSQIRRYADFEEYVKKNSKKLFDSAEKQGRRTTQLKYILEAIAEAEGIKVENADVDREIGLLASHLVQQGEHNLTIDALGKRLNDSGGLEALRADILAKKTLDWLWNNAKK